MNALIGLRDWVDERLPIMKAWNTHMGQYWTPKNFNVWYFFGVFSLLVLVNQLLTGIWLTMLYVPTAEGAFASVEYIMRDVEYGWLLRYMHSTGAMWLSPTGALRRQPSWAVFRGGVATPLEQEEDNESMDAKTNQSQTRSSR